jgi:hypothetical protein
MIFLMIISLLIFNKIKPLAFLKNLILFPDLRKYQLDVFLGDEFGTNCHTNRPCPQAPAPI